MYFYSNKTVINTVTIVINNCNKYCIIVYIMLCTLYRNE